MEFDDAVKFGKEITGSEILALWCIRKGLHFDRNLEDDVRFLSWRSEMEFQYLRREGDPDLNKIEWIRKIVKESFRKRDLE